MFMRWQTDGRQAACSLAGSESEVRVGESERLTREELNKLEEMMLELFASSAMEIMFSSLFVCLLVIKVCHVTLLDRFQ